MIKTKNKVGYELFKEKTSNLLSKLSKAFMLPIAILPIAGLLLGIGGAIGSNTNSAGATDFANFLKGMSEVIFGNLAILFGASIAMSFTNVNKVSAVFMTLVAYFAFSGVQGAFIHNQNGFHDIFYFHTNPNLKYMIASNLGIKSLQTSIFGGIIIGAMVSYVMNRYSEIELPTALGFFSGIRLVPMILLPLSALLAIVFLVIWPYVGTGIGWLGNQSSAAPAGLDGLVYGMLGRSLMPFGLHHIVIGMAWQSDLGGHIDTKQILDAAAPMGVENTAEVKAMIDLLQTKYSGSVVGDQNIWNFLNSLSFNTIPINMHGGSQPVFEWFTNNVGIHPGRFMQDYPVYIGACVGVGAAIIMTADKDKRKKTAAITGSAMAVAFLTGITEPLEFSFLFIAPLFYFGIYVPLSGLAYMLMKISGAHVGVGFARGIIDLIIYGAIPIQKGTNFWWAFIYAGGFGAFSFITFYLMIKYFKWETPGRGSNNVELITKKKYKELQGKGSHIETEISDLVKAYGGSENLEFVTACATRLRITVADPTKIDKNKIMSMGAAGFIDKGKASQAIFGGRAAILANKVNELYVEKIGKKTNTEKDG